MLSDRQLAEPSSVVTAKVVEARLRVARRLEGTHWRPNEEIPRRRSCGAASGPLRVGRP